METEASFEFFILVTDTLATTEKILTDFMTEWFHDMAFQTFW